MLHHGNTLVQLLHCLLYPPVSSNQHFHPLHSCFCRNLNRATRSGIVCDFPKFLREFLNLVVNPFTRQTLPAVNRRHFFMNILCIESFCPQKITTERCSSVGYSQARSLFSLLKPASEHAHARLISRLSWSWTVLLHSGTNRKPITSITVAMLPSVTYILTLPRMYQNKELTLAAVTYRQASVSVRWK
jgi:hypothetical protein